MADKLHDYGNGDLGFHCPGCGSGHSFRVSADFSLPQWMWNGSMDNPTFTPSLLINQGDTASRCHSYVTDGKIRFLSDCWHSLKGQQVELPDWDAVTELSSQQGNERKDV